MAADKGSDRYRGILFDLDGTLVDTADLILASYRHTMREHLGRVLPDEEWLRTMGRPLVVQLADFARSPEEAEAMLETYLEHNQENHERLIRSFPGVLSAVRAIRDAGYALGIVTSKLRAQALRELRTFEMEDLFRVLVAADDVEQPKPDPEGTLQAARRLRLDPSDLLLVGDSVHDLRAGRAAGCETAAALWGPYDRETLSPAEPDHWLESIEDLLRLLGLMKGTADG